MEKENKKIKLKVIILVSIAIIITIVCVALMNMSHIMESTDSNEEVKNINYDNLTQALNGYYDRINKTEDEDEKERLLNELHDYVLSDFQGYYYYREDNRYRGSTYMRNHFPEQFTNEKDDRIIYVKNKDEVYIVPYSEEYLKEKNIELSQIDTIENSELYKYKITDIETSDKYGKRSATIMLQTCYTYEKYGDSADKCYTTIKFGYYTSSDSSNDSYDFSGYFADMITENDDVTKYKNNLSNGIAQYREYYRTLDLAIQEDNERMQDYSNSQTIKNSIPKVGMTPSEVRQTKWGSPDKINKDTYSWGTTEQWVYNKYGYVYFRNGKVSSVSER